MSGFTRQSELDLFALTSVDGRRLRFQELASGAYYVDHPVEVDLPPVVLAGEQALALARHLEETGLWRRGPWEEQGDGKGG